MRVDVPHHTHYNTVGPMTLSQALPATAIDEPRFPRLVKARHVKLQPSRKTFGPADMEFVLYQQQQKVGTLSRGKVPQKVQCTSQVPLIKSSIGRSQKTTS